MVGTEVVPEDHIKVAGVGQTVLITRNIQDILNVLFVTIIRNLVLKLVNVNGGVRNMMSGLPSTYLIGKRVKGSVITATHDSSVQRSWRLFIRDCATGYNFLTDFEAELSVPPACHSDKCYMSHNYLYAANGTPVETYGHQILALTLGFRRDFRHNSS